MPRNMNHKIVPFISATLRKNGVTYARIYNNKRKHNRHIKVFNLKYKDVEYVLKVMNLAGLRDVQYTRTLRNSMFWIHSVSGYTLHH